jgi:hypothetical protein
MRDELILKIKKYYASINRDKYPNMDNYTIRELYKVIELFNIF